MLFLSRFTEFYRPSTLFWFYQLRNFVTIYKPSLNQKWTWTRKKLVSQIFLQLWKMDNGLEKYWLSDFFATLENGQWTSKNEALRFFYNYRKWTMDLKNFGSQIFLQLLKMDNGLPKLRVSDFFPLFENGQWT